VLLKWVATQLFFCLRVIDCFCLYSYAIKYLLVYVVLIYEYMYIFVLVNMRPLYYYVSVKMCWFLSNYHSTQLTLIDYLILEEVVVANNQHLSYHSLSYASPSFCYF
jgi:hypothetical protein